MRNGYSKFPWTWILIVCLILLSACTHQIKDGPPPYPVDVSKIPDACPKSEKLSKYGNLSSYKVFGKRYHVLASAKNYQEQGIASWYGTKFHKLRTSSGERYNMLAMTAAHKTLPLPTYVEVTNLKNGNKVIVKVNDRGPFAPNRLIDLSYVAAKKLGMIGHGTTYVNVKAIDPNEALRHKELFAKRQCKENKLVTASSAHSKHDSSLYLQVGAFKNKIYAENLRKKVKPLVPSSPVNLAKTKKLYRVQIGPLKDLATVDSIKKKLKSMGLTAQHIKV